MDSEKLTRYLAGLATEAERSQVETWAAASASRDPELVVVSKILASDKNRNDWNVDSAWGRVSARLDDRARIAAPSFELRRRSAPVRWLAAAAVLLAVGVGLWQLRKDTTPAAQTYATEVGSKPHTVNLPDGSSITLAPASKLVVLKGYGDKVRRVQLSGRAWFNVIHDPARPFEVLVGEYRIKDLGTEFDVDSSAAGIRVAVRSGSVAVVSPSGDSVVLVASDVVVVNKGVETKVDHHVDTRDFGAWQQGTLAFTNQTLGEVAAELERWYDVKIDIAPSLASRRITFDVNTGMDLKDVLAVITAVDPSAVSRTEGRKVYLEERSKE